MTQNHADISVGHERCGLKPLVISLVGTYPLPDKFMCQKNPHSPVMIPDTDGPVRFFQRLEMQGGIKRIAQPNPEYFTCQDLGVHRQFPVQSPEFSRAPADYFHRWHSRGGHSPAPCSAAARLFKASNLPEAASAFIWRSQSSSGRAHSSDINSAFSASVSMAMASRISVTLIGLRLPRLGRNRKLESSSRVRTTDHTDGDG